MAFWAARLPTVDHVSGSQESALARPHKQAHPWEAKGKEGQAGVMAGRGDGRAGGGDCGDSCSGGGPRLSLEWKRRKRWRETP